MINYLCLDAEFDYIIRAITNLNIFLDSNKTNLKEENKSVIKQYVKRFNIEKMFQDQKSSLFNIEQTQVRKYSKFKKLYYIVNLVQAIMMLMGNFIEEKLPELKKKVSHAKGNTLSIVNVVRKLIDLFLVLLSKLIIRFLKYVVP